MMRKLVFGIALVALSSVVSGQEKTTGSLTDVTGVWIMLIEGHQVGLELEQKGTTLKGEKAEDGLGGPHGSPNAGPIVAQMLDDGTLEGELSTNRGRTKWTGERLRKR